MSVSVVEEQGHPPATHLVRETATSAVINGFLSAAFFYAFFGRQAIVPVWGVGHFVFDFLPQGFMVAMMGSLVPGLLARKAWLPDRPGIAAPARIVSWALRAAIAAAVFGTALVAAVVWIGGIGELEFTTGLIAKIFYGVMLALLVTPRILLCLWASQSPPMKVPFTVA